MPDTVQDLIRRAAAQHGVPEALALAVAEQESGLNPTLVNKESGATGTFQLLPATAAMLKVDHMDPRQNIDGGVRYLRQLLDQSNGDLDKVLRTYGGVKTEKGAYYAPEVMARLGKFKNLPPLGEALQALGGVPAAAGGTTGAAADLSDVGTGGASLRARTAGAVDGAAQAAQRIGPGYPGWVDAATTTADRLKRGTRALASSFATTFNPTTGSGRNNIAGAAGAAATVLAPEIALPLRAGKALQIGKVLSGTGEAGLTAMKGVIPAAIRTVLPAAGAAAGGGASEALNQTMAGQGINPEKIKDVALEQGASEAIGGAATYVGRKILGHVVAPAISRNARKGLAAEEIALREANISAGQTVAAQSRARIAATQDAQRLAAQGYKDALDANAAELAGHAGAIKAAVRRRVPTAATLPGEAGMPLAELELETVERLADAQNTLRDLRASMAPQQDVIAQNVRQTVIGRPGVFRMTDDEVEGGAARALREAGEQVRAAAALPDAPRVSTQAFKDAAARFQAEYPPEGILQPAQMADDTGELIDAAPTAPTTTRAPELPGNPSPNRGKFAAAEDHRRQIEAMEALVARQEPGTAPRVLGGVIGLMQNAPDDIAFEDAHLVKTMLDSVVNWGAKEKSIPKEITKSLRNTLRTSMRGFAPYDQANRVYQGMVPLYERGVTRRVIDAVGRNASPDRVEFSLRAKDGVGAARLRRLLIDQSALGGDAAAGQAAWDGITDAWMHRRLLQGAPEKLGERIAALNDTPLFRETLLSQPKQAAAFQNLQTLAATMQDATARMADLRKQAGMLGDAGAETTNAMLDKALKSIASMNDAQFRAFTEQQEKILRGVHEANTTAEQAVAQAGRFAKDRLRTSMQDLADSSISPATTLDLTHTEADALTAVMRFQSYWGTMAALRLAFGPKRADLLKYAMYSGPRTQAFVRLISSPMNDRAAATAVRMAAQQIYGDGKSASPTSSAASPSTPSRQE